jgi:hypothetical protein
VLTFAVPAVRVAVSAAAPVAVSPVVPVAVSAAAPVGVSPVVPVAVSAAVPVAISSAVLIARSPAAAMSPSTSSGSWPSVLAAGVYWGGPASRVAARLRRLPSAA